MVRRAFGIEATVQRMGGPASQRYEDPERARSIASDLEADAGRALDTAGEFLDAQRVLYATRLGDSLPFVQSLCFFATRIKQHRPDIAIGWAREAAQWQPHNPYPAVILGEMLAT